MQEKLRDLMQHEGLKSGQLADLLGINPAAISHILAGRNKPGFDLLQKILRRFPQINPDWLLVDRGPMYREEAPSENRNAADQEATAGNLFASVSPVPSEATAPAPQTPPTTEMPAIAPKQRRAIRVVIFYDDQSFESYTPNNA